MRLLGETVSCVFDSSIAATSCPTRRTRGNKMACHICHASLLETRASVIGSTPDAGPRCHLIGSLLSAAVIHSFESLGRLSAFADIEVTKSVRRLQVAFLPFAHLLPRMSALTVSVA